MGEHVESRPRTLRRFAAPLALAIAFVLVHLLVGWGDLVRIGSTETSGDVTGVYRVWMDAWRDTGQLVGIDTSWVYPIGALPAMLLAFVAGDDGYLIAWLAIVTALNAVAMTLLARRSMPAAWWWLACILLLGPIALSRVDGVALPFAVIGVLAVQRRPAVASVLFTVAAWIKVWPAALVAALLVAGRRRAAVLSAALFTTAAVLAVGLAAGARGTLFSFIGTQANRGLQIEAPIATPWLIWGAAGGPVRIYYDTQILTFQVQAAGAVAAATWMTPVLVAGVLAVVVLALLALRRGVDRNTVLALTALGLVLAVIAFNKVGSPQYLTWLVAPVLLGLLSTRTFRTPAVLVLVTSALTQLIYPIGYDRVLALDPLMIGVLAVRNLLLLVGYAWCIRGLAAARSGPAGQRAAPTVTARADR